MDEMAASDTYLSMYPPAEGGYEQAQWNRPLYDVHIIYSDFQKETIQAHSVDAYDQFVMVRRYNVTNEVTYIRYIKADLIRQIEQEVVDGS